ncbi:MAG TPA: SpoIIE family protein phosphatase [Holophagaceae bacterium]|nr:SpoIIE family protein phosphatase [Holophagaceae bacterium]
MTSTPPSDPSLRARLGRAWGAFSFRKHGPWVGLVLGFVLLPVTQGGCLALLLVGWSGAVLCFRGLAWLWWKMLFRVSRRLWAILGFLSVLPVLGLGVLLISLAWLALGAQVSRTTQQNLEAWEQAVRLANAQASDRDAVLALRTHGQAWISHVKTLPKGVKPTFVGLVWDRTPKGEGEGLKGTDEDIFLLGVHREEGGFRLLRLELGRMGIQSQNLMGGAITYRLQPAREPREKDLKVQTGKGRQQVVSRAEDEVLAEWVQGERPTGSWLFAPFNLPPQDLAIVEWTTGRPLLLNVKPETSLGALFRGYATRERQPFSEGTFVAIVAVVSLLFVIALGQIVATILGLRMAWTLGASVDDLDRGVRRLSDGDFGARIRPRTKDQIGRLAESFNAMAAQLQSSLHEREVRLQLEEELRVAREVQTRLLPDVATFGLGAQVQATLLPAREVAGDFYDLHRLPGGKLAFLVADVSGKGTSAAFYAAELKGMVAALGPTLADPVEAAERLNAIWCASHDKRTFITLAFGTFDPATGGFAFVRAGHTPGYLRRLDGTVTRLQPRGLGIGLTARGFRERLDLCEGRLAPGETLLLFTDGLSEAHGPDDALYGDDRIVAVLQTAADPVPALLADVAAFTGDGPLADDLTLMVLRG